MADSETVTEPARPPRTPRWVKAFGIVAAVLVVLVILMITGVFGEGHGPGRHMGGRNKVEGVGGPVDSAQAARTVELTALDTMTFQPAAIRVSAGEIVTFAVTNGGKAVHEFNLGDAAMQQQHADAMAHIPPGMHHSFPNSITIQPGETKQLTWKFGEGGTLEFACHQPGHYAAGMRGQITIG